MPSKYKMLGIGLIIFILLIAWVFLKPKEGISTVLFEPKNIDSIHLYGSGKTKTIYPGQDVRKVCQELQKIVMIDPDRINVNTGFIDLFFFLKNQTKPVTIRIMYNAYNGIIINANDIYYKNDSLNAVVTAFMSGS